MTVETDDAVGARHDDVQIVGDEQDAEAGLVAQAGDEVVEVRLARVVDALHRLVENQEVGSAQQCARQQHALQLAARQLAELLMADGFGVDVSQNLGDGMGAGAASQHQKALNRHRNDGVAVEALRNVADAQILAAMHGAAIGLLETQQHAHQGRLAGAVEADERDDLALADVEVDVEQQVTAVARDANAAGRDQRRRIDLLRPSAHARADASRHDHGCGHTAPPRAPLLRSAASGSYSFFGAQLRHSPETSTNFTRG